jgi:hypothetical protein
MRSEINPERMGPESLRALCSELLSDVQELEAEIRQIELEADARARIRLARIHEAETMDRYSYDGTGQDGEYEIRAAIQGRLDAEDQAFRERDPDAYAERRAMYGF